MLEINTPLTKKTILVTGAAGFIGSNLVLDLIRTQSPCTIIGIDNMNDYYDVSIKEYRLTRSKQNRRNIRKQSGPTSKAILQIVSLIDRISGIISQQ